MNILLYGRHGRVARSGLFLAVALVTFLCTRAEATLVYNFEEEGTGTVLATLHLSSLPATYQEVTGLTFTPAGQAIFDLGPIYLGTFDSGGHFDDDGMGGLHHPNANIQATFFDADAPSPPNDPPFDFSTFQITADGEGDPRPDEMLRLDIIGGTIFGGASAEGDWRLITGDANGDGWVDGLDYLIWARNFGGEGGVAEGNFDGNSFVDSFDYLIWAREYGNHAATSVPEPGTLVMLLIGVAACGVNRRRR